MIYSKSALIELKREFYGFFFTFAAPALADSRVAISDSVGVWGLSSGSVEINSCPWLWWCLNDVAAYDGATNKATAIAE